MILTNRKIYIKYKIYNIRNNNKLCSCQGTRWGEARLAGHGRDRATWATHEEGVGEDYIVYSDRRGEETSCCVRKEKETEERRTESIYMRMLRLAWKTLLA